MPEFAPKKRACVIEIRTSILGTLRGHTRSYPVSRTEYQDGRNQNTESSLWQSQGDRQPNRNFNPAKGQHMSARYSWW